MIKPRTLLLTFLICALAPNSVSITTFQQWQCSYSDHGTVLELLSRSRESFLTVGFPSWITAKRKYANCFEKGLKRIPKNLRPDIEMMNFGQNSIARLYKNDLDLYPSLVAISLLNNCLTFENDAEIVRRCSSHFTVEKDAFFHLKNLTYLSLDGTVIKQLPEMLPKSLLVLFASTCSMGPIQKVHVNQLTSLEIVSFSTNCIGGDLKHFCLGNFTIENPVFSSPTLKFLDLAYNNFSIIPSYLFQQSLLGIKLRGNPIRCVKSQDFTNSTNITYLNLAWTSQYFKKPLQIEQGAFHLLLNLQTLHLGGNMISRVPENFLARNLKLKKLNLAFNCLKFIEANPSMLPSLPLLEELYVAGNSFCNDTLEPVKFAASKLHLSKSYVRFPNLTTLAIGTANPIPNSIFISSYFLYNFLYGTRYDKVDKESFNVLRKLSRLRTLAITTSGICTLDTSAFSDLNLTYLDLSFNHMGEVADNCNAHFCGIQQNYTINAARSQALKVNQFNQIFDIKDVFDHPSQVYGSDTFIENKVDRVARLSRNAISDLGLYPLKFFHFTTYLDLSYNKINYITANTFRDLKYLKLLDLQFNPIRFIHPLSMLPLYHLSELRFNFSEFFGEISLDFLSNAQNDISLRYGDNGYNIYRVLFYSGINNVNFSRILRLDVSGIRVPTYYLSNDKSLFKPLPNLIELKMNEAKITFHPQTNFFRGIPKLKWLSMSGCWLEHFPDVALKLLYELTYLDLSQNKIEVLDKRFIPDFRKLKTLKLSRNYIHTITSGTLQILLANGLTSLDLSYNQIKNIGPSIITRPVLNNISHLDLRGNILHCDCSLSETFGWLVYSREEPVGHFRLPGFLPQCSYSVMNYYGGCLVCSDVKSDQLFSLFTYSITQNCQEDFLQALVISFCMFFATFLLISLMSTNEIVQKKLFDFLVRKVRWRRYNEKESHNQDQPLLYVYDAFVYYDKNDTAVADWVDEILLSQIASENPDINVGVVGRDDWCGHTLVQQLLLRMKASRKTIVVMSQHSSNSLQCQYVLSVLEQWAYDFNRNSCIILCYGVDCLPPKLSLKGRNRDPYSMLYYSTTSENNLFWKLLIHAITFPST